MAKKKRRRTPKIARISTSDISLGPVRHAQLPPDLEARARELYSRAFYLCFPTFEQSEIGYLREVDPGREIAIEEAIVDALDKYLSEHPDADKKSVLNILLIKVTQTLASASEPRVTKELRQLFEVAWRNHPDWGRYRTFLPVFMRVDE